MPISQVIRVIRVICNIRDIRDVRDLMDGLTQTKITHTDAKKKARSIVSDDTYTLQKLYLWRQALDAYCAEPT